MWHSPRRHDDFWVGADHHLHHAFYLDGVWSDDEDLGGVVAGDFVFGGWRPDIVDNKPRPQQLRVAVVGVDGYRHELVYQAAAGELLDERGGGGAWRPWARVGGQG